jgi:Ca2+-binding RTX toxin-like protein
MATPYIYVNNVVVDEGDGSIHFLVRLSESSLSTITVKYGFTEKQAGEYDSYYDANYSDFNGASGTLSFSAGETEKTVSFGLWNDATAEAMESFLFTLNTPTNALIADYAARATILDDDVIAGGPPNMRVDDVFVDEGDGLARFTVRLDQAAGGAVTVNYATSNVTATAGIGSDYTGTSGSLTFAAGELVKTVEVVINNDSTSEGDERFNLNLSGATGATLVDGTGAALIARGDGAATSSPYVFSEDVTVSEDAGYVDFRVQLSQASFNTVTVNHGFVELGAGEYDSYYDANYSDFEAYTGSLVFAPGETLKTVRYHLYNDSVAEPIEGLLLSLGVPAGGNAIVAKQYSLATLIDNDLTATTGTQPNLVVDDVIVNENGTHASFTIRLDKASTDAVTVDYATANVSATAGSDYTALAGSLIFAPNEVVKTVQVEIINDATAEGDELFNLSLTNPGGAAIVDGTGTAVISRSDGAAVAAPYISVGDVMVGENAPYVEFRVQLSQASFNQVGVNYSFTELKAGEYDSYYDANYSDFEAYTGSLVFAAGETVKTVRYELYDDSTIESFNGFLFNLTNPTNGILSKDKAYATLIDNDQVADTGTQPNLVVDDVIVNENGTHASFTIRLDKASTDAVTVDYATANVSATAGSDYTALAGSLIFAPNEVVRTVQVEIINDATAEGEERFDLKLGNAVGAGVADGTGTAVIGRSDGSAAAAPGIFVVESQVPEGAPYMEFIIRLDQPGSGSVSVNYSFTEGTAKEYDTYYSAAESDFKGYTGKLVFAPGETIKTLRFDVYDDGVDETDLENFQLVLSGAVGGNITNAIGAGAIADDDGTPHPMALGFADDIYVVDGAEDLVLENAWGGLDLVQSGITYTLPTYVENLILIGTSAIDGTGNAYTNTLTGNGAANRLAGLGGDDSLSGGAGNDTLDGGAGLDSMAGGAGNDSYVVDELGDVIAEAAEAGADDVTSSVTHTLSVNLENLTLAGSAAIDGTGNAANNRINGNGADNTLDGGAGADTLVGGNGDDLYLVDNAGDVVTELAGGGADTVRASVSRTLGTEQDHLILTGAGAINGTGNGLNNQITGNDSANTLDGGGGIDTLTGGGGNDTYVVNLAADVVNELAGGGTDTVRSGVTRTLGDHQENLTLIGSAAVNGTGNGLNNVLAGNAAANLLDGGIGADTLRGAGGNDTYLVDNPGDRVEEAAGAGTDLAKASVNHTLADNVENLLLTGAALNGTGNGLDNKLTGNGLANTLTGLAGNDTLDGGLGNDTLLGGAGNDTYIVNAAGDVVTELAGGGTDTLRSGVTRTLADHQENLVLTGAGAINGTGNTLNNQLTGNDGANVLNGGAGADTLAGGKGNDTYVVDNIGDVVTEAAAGGADTVQSSVTRTLGDHQENLLLTGGAAVDGTGNTLNNQLTGNGAANVLTGGAGQDVFLFKTALSAGNIDQITDFVATDDTIQLDDAIFAALGATGALSASKFASGGAALDGADRILYDSATGDLYYDVDGLILSDGNDISLAAVKFATLTSHPTLTAADFVVV